MQPMPDVDGDLRAEVLSLCQALIRVDTTNPPGRETAAAVLLRDHLEAAGVDCELVARDPDRANLVARIPGSGGAPSLAFVGHLDVVPADPRDWTHPPFDAVVDDGYLYGRGAVDMKNELAARVVAMARLARSGFRPRGDLWLLAVADEEDGSADVGMRWLLEHRPDIRPDFALNEGDGLRLELTDGRAVMGIAVGDKGTYPARVTAIGEAAHASMPEQGRNAVPLLAELLRRVGSGLPDPHPSPVVDRMVAVLTGRAVPDDADGYRSALATAAAMHPALEHLVPAVAGHHDGADDAHRVEQAQRDAGPGQRRARLPDPARHDRGRRRARGAGAARRRHPLRAGLAGAARRRQQLACRRGRCSTSARRSSTTADPGTVLLPSLSTGFTDSVYLRAACGTVAYGFSPMLATPPDVALAGFHAKDERVHVDDLSLAVQFHEQAARALLG